MAAKKKSPTPDKAFIKRLTDLMNKEGLSQRDLALKSGMSEASISKYISGERYPIGTSAIRLAKALNTTVDNLVGRKFRKDDNIFYLREKEGLSQSMFVKKYHISKQSLVNWEAARTIPPKYVCANIRRIQELEDSLRKSQSEIDGYKEHIKKLEDRITQIKALV